MPVHTLLEFLHYVYNVAEISASTLGVIIIKSLKIKFVLVFLNKAINLNQ